MAEMTVPPARGLKYLTWAQVEAIDQRLVSLAAYASQTKTGVALMIILNENGRLVALGEPVVISKIKPGR